MRSLCFIGCPARLGASKGLQQINLRLNSSCMGLAPGCNAGAVTGATERLPIW